MIREFTSVRRGLNKNRNVDEAHRSQVTPTEVDTLSTPQATTSDRDAMMTGLKEAMSCTKCGLIDYNGSANSKFKHLNLSSQTKFKHQD